MNNPGDGSSPAGSDVGGGPGNRAGRRKPAEKNRSDISRPLRDQFHIGTMTRAEHAIGHYGRQQGFKCR